MSKKYVELENLIYYDKKIKEYIQDNNSGTIEGSGIKIYDDYSKLPTDLTEKTIAYCENDYIDNTDVDNPITYNKGWYLFDSSSVEWGAISLDLTDIPIATKTSLGVVSIGKGILIDENGTISAELGNTEWNTKSW